MGLDTTRVIRQLFSGATTTGTSPVVQGNAANGATIVPAF